MLDILYVIRQSSFESTVQYQVPYQYCTLQYRITCTNTSTPTVPGIYCTVHLSNLYCTTIIIERATLLVLQQQCPVKVMKVITCMLIHSSILLDIPVVVISNTDCSQPVRVLQQTTRQTILAQVQVLSQHNRSIQYYCTLVLLLYLEYVVAQR